MNDRPAYPWSEGDELFASELNAAIANGGRKPFEAPPLMDGTADAGASELFARGDHVHPSDTSRLALTGGTLTGPLTLANDPTAPEMPVTLAYFNSNAAGAGSGAGGAVPEAPTDGTTYGRVMGSWHGVLRLDGGTLSGPLNLFGTPTADTHAAPKSYVDAHAGSGIVDPPSDGKLNVRCNGAWTDQITAAGASTSRNLPAYFSDAVNLKNFGAKLDGTTNDVAAAQAARSSITTDYGIVYAPPGQWLMSGALTGGRPAGSVLWRLSGITDAFHNPVHSAPMAGDVMENYVGYMRWERAHNSAAGDLTVGQFQYTVTNPITTAGTNSSALIATVSTSAVLLDGGVTAFTATATANSSNNVSQGPVAAAYLYGIRNSVISSAKVGSQIFGTNIYASDRTGLTSSFGGSMVGTELGTFANGLDDGILADGFHPDGSAPGPGKGSNRIILNLVGGRTTVGVGAQCEIGNALRISGTTGDGGDAGITFKNGVAITAPVSFAAFNTRHSTMTGTAQALLMQTGQTIGWTGAALTTVPISFATIGASGSTTNESIEITPNGNGFINANGPLAVDSYIQGAGGIAIPAGGADGPFLTARQMILPLGQSLLWNTYTAALPTTPRYSVAGYASDIVTASDGTMRFDLYPSGTAGSVLGAAKTMSFDQSGNLTIPGKFTGVAGDVPNKAYVDAQDALAVPLAGGSMTGTLILNGDPVFPTDAATKHYVDTTAPPEPPADSATYGRRNTGVSKTWVNLASGLPYLPLAGGTVNGAVTVTASSFTVTAGLNVTVPASAVNAISLTGSVTGADPLITTVGDASRNLSLQAAGSGQIMLRSTTNLGAASQNSVQVVGSAAGALPLVTMTGADANRGIRITGKAAGGVVVGSGAAIATTAAGPFLLIPFGAGPPTGVPTDSAAGVALYYDTTNNKLCAYSGGAWKSTTFA